MPRKMGETCYAPVFKEHSVVESVVVSVICYMVMAILLPFYRVSSVQCLIKQCQFRIRYCLRGNDNPCIPL